MKLAEVQVKWSVILMDLLGPDISSTLWKQKIGPVCGLQNWVAF